MIPIYEEQLKPSASPEVVAIAREIIDIISGLPEDEYVLQVKQAHALKNSAEKMKETLKKYDKNTLRP